MIQNRKAVVFVKFKQIDNYFKIAPKRDIKLRNFGRVVLPINLIDTLYFNNNIDELLMGSPHSPFTRKLRNLQNSLLENGWQPTTDYVALNFQDGQFFIANGQHRMIMAKALNLPYVTCNLLCVYSNDEEREQVRKLLKEINKYEKELHPTSFKKKDFKGLESMRRKAFQRNIWKIRFNNEISTGVSFYLKNSYIKFLNKCI